MYLGPVEWGRIFIPQTPLLEIFVRVSAVYLLLLLALRMVSRRQLGHLAISDLLLLVLLASSVRLGLTGHDPSVGTAAIAGGTLLFWEWLIDQVAYRIPASRALLRKRALPVIQHGQIVRENARKELLTEDEIMEELRKQGLNSIQDCMAAYVEPDGRLSIIPADHP
jgi:uncharacterized membrane protein YcaP (DUF421 family)